MKLFLKYLAICLIPSLLFSQNEPTEAINGTYHLLLAERGIGNKQTKTQIFQYALFGETKTLFVAACSRCAPSMYKYKDDDSEAFGAPVFFNPYGLYMITYDEDSFIMIRPADKNSSDWTDFSYSNFYSKDITKVSTMTKEKIKAFVLGDE